MFAHLLGTCVKISAAPWQLPKQKRFWPQEKSEFGIAQRSQYASTQKVHRPGSQSSLHFDTEIIWQTRTEK